MDTTFSTQIHRGLTVAALTLALGAMTLVPAAPAAAALNPDDQIVAATNSYRTSKGEHTLARHAAVDNVAQAWAEKMLATRTLKHNPSYGDQMPQSGLMGWAENVAYSCRAGGPSANVDVVIRGWKNSEGHRRNMLNSSFTDIGVGVAYSGKSDCLYAVQNFGKYLGAASASNSPSLSPSKTVPSSKFWDVPRGHKFCDEITWLAGTGITTGYSDGSYRPSDEVTREAFAAFMYRLDGKPSYKAPSRSPFKDVSTGSQFYKEIAWMSSADISNGWADGTFRPKDRISREAMAAFLYRYYDQPSTRVNAAARFKDLGWGDKFLREISWLANERITTGYADGTFKPHAPVTREAMAAFLERATD